MPRSHEVISTTVRVAGGVLRAIQYRERSDRMPALDNRKNSKTVVECRHPVASLAVLY